MTREPGRSVWRARVAAAMMVTAGPFPASPASAEAVRRWNPPTLFDSPDFSHLAEVGDVDTHIFVAGLGPQDSDGRIDRTARIRGQTRAVLHNLDAALDAAGAGRDDIIRIHVYVVDYRMMEGMIISRQVRRFFGGRMPVSSFIPVDRLLWPGARVQIDAEAALNGAAGD